MQNHSSAPWAIGKMGKGRATITSDSGNHKSFQVCEVWNKPTAEEADANAALIAAAPDLLAALKDLFEQCAMVHKHWGEGSNTQQADAAIKAAQAAITRAEGGEA